MKKEFEFMGRPSGDGEHFCWAVDKETFIKIARKEPDVYDYLNVKYTDAGEFISYGDELKLYPDDIFQKSDNDEDFYIDGELDYKKFVDNIRFENPIKIKIEFEI